jgi:hypothetical protein
MNKKEPNYEGTIAKWIADFIETMEYTNPDIGDISGDKPFGIKIMFDGYGFNEKTNDNDDLDVLTFAVFIHRNCLDGNGFPDHETTPWGIVHRPDQEICIFAYYEKNTKSIDVVPFEDGNNTKLSNALIYQLINNVENGNHT